MTDQKQEARTLTLGERMVLAAQLAVEEHLRQSVTTVPLAQSRPERRHESWPERWEDSYFGRTDYREVPRQQVQFLEDIELDEPAVANELVGAP